MHPQTTSLLPCCFQGIPAIPVGSSRKFTSTSIGCALSKMHVFKKIRNNIESSKCIVWEHWEECFKFNFQNGFSIHNKLTEEHINLTPSSKMRNELAIQVLNKDMLYLMKAYQATLHNPQNLASSIELLENTSK